MILSIFERVSSERMVLVTTELLLSKLGFAGRGPSCQILMDLKVLTNEKRGGLPVVSFDRPGYKLFSRWFSNKSMQAPSCERHKTALRTLFLLFANNICFPMSEEKLLALFEFSRFLEAGGGQHSLVVCCIASFFLVLRIFKAASPMIAMTLK